MLPKKLEKQLQVFNGSRVEEFGIVTCGILFAGLGPPGIEPGSAVIGRSP
jgi:hypothetical protein